MNDNNKQLIALEVKGVSLPVRRVESNCKAGISITHLDGDVFITITCRGIAHYALLHGDDIDIVARLMADAMSAATRAAPPTMETRQ